MGQISGGEPAVECSLVCEFNGGGQLKTEYLGSYQRYQSMANTLETQAATGGPGPGRPDHIQSPMPTAWQ